MVSHQTPDTKTTIPAVRDSGNSHVTNMDNVYQPSPRISRLANPRPLGDSMLAYTQRMREIAQFRKDSALLAPTESALAVSSEAHHEKNGGLWKKGPQNPRRHYRPLSFDELVARKAKVEPNTRLLKKKNRRYSVPNKLPSPAVSPEPKQDKDRSQVHINFVSASDLFELVSFSLRSKPSRDESMRQARFEDSLKLMKDSDFFGSLPSRLPVKAAFEAKEEDEDKETLVVQGFPSPRDTLKEGQKTKFLSRNVNKSRRNHETNKNSHLDVNNEETPNHPEPNQPPNLDLLREKHVILLQPQKLRHRPKRAKRMALHRSLLTAIPEDERRRQEDMTAQTQEVPATRMPVMPTSSSLTAIKSMRKDRTENTTNTQKKTPCDELDIKGNKSSKDKLSKLAPIQEITHENAPAKSSHKTSTESTHSEQHKHEPGNSPRHDKSLPVIQNGAFPRRKNTSDKSSFQNSRNQAAPSELSRTRARALTGQSLPLLAPESRIRAQKKFSKLIFLRDTTDHVYHKYS